MAKNVCLTRIENLLTKSSIKGAKKDEIISAIKLAQAEKKITNIDEVNVDVVAKEVSEQIKLQKKINKRNAIEDEIKTRRAAEYVLTNFSKNPEEGLIALMVGSNERIIGARASVAVQQQAVVNGLIGTFEQKLRDNKLTKMFKDGLEGISERETQKRVANTMEELGQRQTDIEKRTGIKPPITETNPRIIKLAEIMEEFSEMLRTKLNDRGANIAKMWGYIVKQSHDPYLVRDAAKRLGQNLDDIKIDPNLKSKKDINYNKNFTAWKNFTLQKLDKDRTFADVDDVDEFMLFVYNSLVGNKYLKSDGAEFSYGARASKDVAKSSKFKRVLHFKDSTEWFEYNDKFGVGNLKESFMSGLQTVGRNIGMLETLGTKPSQNFEKIRYAVQQRMIKEGRDTTNLKSGRTFDKYLKVIDGSIYTVENFGVAKYSAIARALASMASLGGATISAAADVGIYGSEMKHQGRSFLGGIFEAMSSLARIKNSKTRKQIAQMNGFIADNTIYDVAGRHQVGDNLSKGWTNAQRFFFKVNLLSWWTNTLKEGAMLGMSNYYAKQKNLKFSQLNDGLKGLFETYNIDSVKWDIIRKNAIEKADDGTEFLNIGMLDQISNAEIKKITGIDDLNARELRIEKDKFKASISGMLLDRSTTAVIEPDARVKGQMTQGFTAGTGLGESIRFMGQFKAFPISIMQKVLGREINMMKSGRKGDFGRGATGMAAIMATTIVMGYISMTAKDILKGKSPRELNYKTLLAAILQGGGLGLYGDVIFKETRTAIEKAGTLLGPIPLSGLDVLQAITFAITGEGTKSARSAYKAIKNNIPFLNLFYIKTAFDYLIGFSMMETMSPGSLKRVEKRMKKDYGQEFLLTKPSTLFKGF